MAGHSKWANIKHRKGAQDARRAKIFTRVIKEITIAAKESGPDPTTNPKLRLAISNGKSANMPKSTIEKAISKAAEKDSASFQELTYEGYGQNGIGIFVECLTDNLNRTVSEVRAAFNKYNGNLGTNGCLSFMFERKGIFVVKKNDQDPDEIILELIEAGAEDVETDDENFLITCSLENYGNMQKAIEKLGLEIDSANLERIPNDVVSLSSEENKKVMRLINALEDVNDVQSVYHNMELLAT